MRGNFKMKKTNTFTISKGILFGTLLSAAQLTWADSAPLLEPGMRIECVSDPRPATYIIQLQYDSVAPLYVQENFLNEERFAKIFCRGHFYNKKWGRKKITAALMQKNISSYCIKKGMQEIEASDYQNTLEKLFTEKWNSLQGEKNKFVKMTKTKTYLIQKGFEADLILSLFQQD